MRSLAPSVSELGREPGLYLVTGSPAEQPSLLEKWHLFSLDAPTIATLWTVFVAHVWGTPLSWATAVAMFVAVWMIYAGDRLLDTRFTVPPAGLSFTVHRFHAKYRNRFVAAISAAALALVCLVRSIPERTLRSLVPLAALLGAWMLIVHVGAIPSRARPLPKGVAVGLFFAAAVFLPSRTSDGLPGPQRLAAALLFGAVCMLNCAFLHAWKSPRRPLLAIPIPESLRSDKLWIAVLVVLACCAALSRTKPSQTVAIACALSTLCLLAIHAVRLRFRPLSLRAAADLALLTPVLFFVHGAWHR